MGLIIQWIIWEIMVKKVLVELQKKNESEERRGYRNGYKSRTLYCLLIRIYSNKYLKKPLICYR
jgi:hypothetical protein